MAVANTHHLNRIAGLLREKRTEEVALADVVAGQGARVRYASLQHLGHYYEHVYMRWMEHWKGILGDGIIEARYERLVANPGHEMRQLVERCGLPWHDACSAFHRSEQPVFTANMRQARRPVYTGSVDRWRKFSDHLQPLLTRLASLEDRT